MSIQSQQIVDLNVLQGVSASDTPPVVGCQRRVGSLLKMELKTPDQPRGSKQYRGFAGVLGKSIEQLLALAEENSEKRSQQKEPLP